MGYRAVIFDLGGVVFDSPLHAIARYERERELPPGFINRVVASTAPGGAWSRLERGELSLDAFYPAFENDCAGAGQRISARAMMGRIAEATAPRESMLFAIARIRERGLRVAALTNNWDNGDASDSHREELDKHFHVVVESRLEGLRKPDPEIYRRVCARLEVAAGDAIFLDDIGANLKPARALGMTTLKVEDPDHALGELAGLLGFAITRDT